MPAAHWSGFRPKPVQFRWESGPAKDHRASRELKNTGQRLNVKSYPAAKFCPINKTVRRPGASRFWSFNLSSMNYLLFAMSKEDAWRDFAYTDNSSHMLETITVHLTAQNAPLFESLRCRAEDLFLLEWESWSYTGVIRSQDSTSGQQYLQLCMTTVSARTRAYGGKEIPTSPQSHALHPLLTCSYAELL